MSRTINFGMVFLLAGIVAFGCAKGRQNGAEPATPKPMPVASSDTDAGNCGVANTAIADYQSVIDNAPQEFVKLMTLFPKGGDIHNHLSGSIMPEDYIAMGAANGDCYDTAYKLSAPPCTGSLRPLADASPEDRQQLMKALSMYQFGYPDIQSGHDHFFSTFGSFGAVSGAAQGAMLAKLLLQAKSENVNYVESMASFQGSAISTMTEQLASYCQRQQEANPGFCSDPGNFAEMFSYLQRIGINDAAVAASADIDRYIEQMNQSLNCGTASADPACAVQFRFLAEVNRNSEQLKMFTQTALSFLLANSDARVVGVNLVSGEDLQTSMQNFDIQMSTFKYYHTDYPNVNIALHAGEITPCFIGAENPALKNHIVGSINAGAKRIGHGISFAFLNDSDKAEVVQLMKSQNTLVEILFTSNAQILGIAGAEHPFSQYFRDNGLPTSFSTDDEGVSYADYSEEWIYGVIQYGLSYEDIVAIARYSLQYSFLPGKSLWENISTGQFVSPCLNQPDAGMTLNAACTAFLNGSEKAATQWAYEKALAEFYENHGAAFKDSMSTIASLN